MTVEELLAEVGRLDRAEQLRLLDELVRLLDGKRAPSTPVTVLRGLGADIWGGTDAQEYVNRERDTWGG